MKLELTNPKIWKKLSERNISVKDRIKIYEKLGGAYRFGENEGEQVFNKITEVIKFKINEAGDQDHEVSMGQNTLDAIIKNAQELKQKLGNSEKNLPAWIQDHLSVAANNIEQANTNYHEYN
jgi:hypothetical protein